MASNSVGNLELEIHGGFGLRNPLWAGLLPVAPSSCSWHSFQPPGYSHPLFLSPGQQPTASKPHDANCNSKSSPNSSVVIFLFGHLLGAGSWILRCRSWEPPITSNENEKKNLTIIIRQVRTRFLATFNPFQNFKADKLICWLDSASLPVKFH